MLRMILLSFAGLLTLLILGFSADLLPFLPASALPSSPAADVLLVDHDERVRMQLRMTTSGNRVQLDISQSGSGAVELAVPASWTITTVQGVPLRSLTRGAPAFGLQSLSLPPRVIITFVLRRNHPLVLHNPSGIPLQLRLEHIDLDHDIRDDDVLLVQDAPAQLW